MEKSTVLIADENPDTLEQLAKIMEDAGVNDLIQADSANHAWSLIRLRDLSCIIAAWDMQEMSGLALLRIVRSIDRHYHTPFFLIHSAYTEGMVIMAGQEGVTGLIVHPFNIQNIKNKIASLKHLVTDPAQAEAEKDVEDALNLIENESYSTALGILDNVLKNEETAEYYYNIGYVKTSQGLYSEAIQAFRKATAIDRLYAKAYEGMGRAYQKMGKNNEAEKYMIKAADIHMSKENVSEAEEVLNEIKEINPNTVNIYNSLGVLYRKKGDFKKALFNYKKALVIHPDRVRIHYNIGRLHIEMKDPETAKSYFAKALELDPGFEDAKEVLDAIELGTF
jgi:Tfp pilus assembly protein PilF/FixJ family two-component response regulator